MADPTSKTSSNILSNDYLVKHQGFWCHKMFFDGIEAMQREFQARPDDLILASCLKTGTTWIKSITYAILTCKQYNGCLNHPTYPLNQNSPHELVPNIEFQLYGPFSTPDSYQTSAPMSSRILHTHVPYQALPESIKSLGCKIIYIARNPKDAFVSLWQQANRLGNEKGKEESLLKFCEGFIHTGPFIDHVASYWLQRNQPNMFFLTYEDLTEDPLGCLERLKDFLGCNFLSKENLINIVDKCSFDSLAKLDANKSGDIVLQGGLQFKKDSFFREGKVGGWKKFFTTKMNEEMDVMIQSKSYLLTDDLGRLQFKFDMAGTYKSATEEVCNH